MGTSDPRIGPNVPDSFLDLLAGVGTRAKVLFAIGSWNWEISTYDELIRLSSGYTETGLSGLVLRVELCVRLVVFVVNRFVRYMSPTTVRLCEMFPPFQLG